MRASGRNALAAVALAAAVLARPVAARAVDAADGIYEYDAAKRTGTLALQAVKGGWAFDLVTVTAPSGHTCSAAGIAAGGTTATYRDGQAGFRLIVAKDQVTVAGLLGRVSETPFCGVSGGLTGVYKRKALLDADAKARLKAATARK